MKVSKHFSLGRNQPTLDFVDVDVTDDTPLFIDPLTLRLLPSVWANECISLIQNFFSAVITTIKDGDHMAAKHLLSSLGEPNETHLGLSKGVSKGRGVGTSLAAVVWDALNKSEAAKTGLLEDLEETALMVPGIDIDIVSDITTNLIRKPLIQYTQEMCEIYGIPLTSQVVSGPMWNPNSERWANELVDLPTVSDQRLLLVPKAIVRQHLNYRPDQYYRHYILPHLQQEEMSANTSLVEVLKNGRLRVTKKSLTAKYGSGKKVNAEQTMRNPSILKEYRDQVKAHISPPLDHDDLAEIQGSTAPDWDKIISNVKNTPIGIDGATAYEKAIEDLLTALFYPSLAHPQIQHPLHDGRKRVDITYTNLAASGFFAWLRDNYPAAMIFVECKNYSSDPSNPELDQLAGRFGPSRGKFGILVCRKIENKKLFTQRCRDTADDDRGFIIALDDDDLVALIKAKSGEAALFKQLKTRFDALIM